MWGRRYRLPALLLLATLASAQTYDLVVLGGHVMDPDSGLDAVRNIGIASGKIKIVTTGSIKGKDTIQARNLIVSPGFIDIHSHGQDDENYRYKARDGVTTALEMEIGVWPVAPWYRARDGKALINYGATAGHVPARMAVLHDTGALLPKDNAVTETATAAQVKQVFDDVKAGLDDHALGIGLGIAYVPTTSREEIYNIFKLAAERHTTIYVHMRNPGAGFAPTGAAGLIDSLQEVIGDAAATGAQLHIVHITSMALRQTPLALEMIDGAKVTTECYPYTAGQTRLESAVFNAGWQEQLGISFNDLQWIATGERLTRETFHKYRDQGGYVIIHNIPENDAKLAVTHPGVVIASDGIITDGKGHPRGAGTYAKVLARYVREQKALSTMEALRKMTILPAKRVNLPNKGRIKEGADADITIFDPAKVLDKATYENPAQYSEGIPYVIVNGVPVVRESQLKTGIYPGKPVRR